MNVTIIGGSGLIGRHLAPLLERAGHQVTLASPSRGVDTLTGGGLARALERADVVVDVSNSPSFEEQAVMAFFRTSTANLLAAEKAAGVRHHVALSVVGADRLADNGYMRAKVAQETLIQAATVPYTIVRATQFFEFLTAIAMDDGSGAGARVSTALFQPMAAADVAQFLSTVVPAAPRNGIVEVGGPERIRMDQAVRRALDAHGDGRRVVADARAPYFGSVLDDGSLVAGRDAAVGTTTLEAWLAKAGAAKAG
jgi:uncharacterized protein YbjT (DUF2867 family)